MVPEAGQVRLVALEHPLELPRPAAHVRLPALRDQLPALRNHLPELQDHPPDVLRRLVVARLRGTAVFATGVTSLVYRLGRPHHRLRLQFPRRPGRPL
jgi:hypothetical protein